ncbi:hypothetical protein F5883DRAFT_646218 [Diaporthe sp. PMI_573]|nr:hypothetical protein F5883DRAFT_646218 [Diaporthaceae sp. PMI_573]
MDIYQSFILAYKQLFLAALRNFARLTNESPLQEGMGERLQGAIDQYVVSQFQEKACRLGFKTPKVQQRALINERQKPVESFQTTFPGTIWRGGKPYTNAYLQLQKEAFYKNVQQAHAPDCHSSPTPLYILRNIFYAFFRDMGIGVKQENEDYFEMQGVDQEEVMKVKQENKGDIEMQDPEEVMKVKQENKADIEMQGVNQEEVMKVEQENEDYFKMQGVNQDDSPPKSLQSQSYRPPPGLLGTFGGPPNSWSRHPKPPPPPPPPRRSKPPRKPPQSKAPGFNSLIDTAAKPDGLFVPQNTTPTLAQNTITEDNVKMPRDASKPEPRDDENHIMRN